MWKQPGACVCHCRWHIETHFHVVRLSPSSTPPLSNYLINNTVCHHDNKVNSIGWPTAMFSLKRRAVTSDACADLHANEQNTERERETESKWIWMKGKSIRNTPPLNNPLPRSPPPLLFLTLPHPPPPPPFSTLLYFILQRVVNLINICKCVLWNMTSVNQARMFFERCRDWGWELTPG